jgi:AcrR family transcriptional regulator
MSSTRQKSVCVSKIRDRRVRRTREQLNAAFVELLQRRSYDAIRVSDIAKKADVGRATFYAHYDRKDDLLRAQLERVLGMLIVPKPDEACLLDATPLFEHLRQVRRFYRALLTGPAWPAVSRMTRDIAEKRVTEILFSWKEQTGKRFGLPASVIARFIAGSLFVLIDWWVESEMRLDPEELQSTFSLLAGLGVTGAVEGESSIRAS